MLVFSNSLVCKGFARVLCQDRSFIDLGGRDGLNKSLGTQDRSIIDLGGGDGLKKSSSIMINLCTGYSHACPWILTEKCGLVVRNFLTKHKQGLPETRLTASSPPLAPDRERNTGKYKPG